MTAAAERAFIALGSNLGDREGHLAAARAALAALPRTRLVAASRVEETAPLGGMDQPPYLNQMVALETALEPRALLAACQAIERSRGRVRTERWGARTLDLDLLLYGDRTIDTPTLQVPHPRLRERNFVLYPLHDIAPEYDYVLIDCPPNLGLLTVNGLVAANGVIIPVQTQYYAMKGLTNLVKVINAIRVKLNKDLRILGLLPTFYDGRTNLAKDMLEELRVVGDHHVFDSIVRNTVKLGEAPLVGRPITSYASDTTAARTYRELAREVVELGTN